MEATERVQGQRVRSESGAVLQGALAADPVVVLPGTKPLESRARRQHVESAFRRPMICIPTGSPSDSPAGIEAAGWPVKLTK